MADAKKKQKTGRKPPAGIARLRRSAENSAAAASFATDQIAQVEHLDDRRPPPAPEILEEYPGQQATAPVHEDSAPEPESEVGQEPIESGDATTVPDAVPTVTPPPPAPTAAPRSRRRKAPTRHMAPDAAWSEVESSFKSAKMEPRQWKPFGARLPDDLRRRLDLRLAFDIERTGNFQLALCHYVDAALKQIPGDPDEAAKWATDYLDERGVETPDTTGGSTRLSTSVIEKMRRLKVQLRTRRYGLVGPVHAAAVTRLLDALDELGEPQ